MRASAQKHRVFYVFRCRWHRAAGRNFRPPCRGHRVIHYLGLITVLQSGAASTAIAGLQRLGCYKTPIVCDNYVRALPWRDSRTRMELLFSLRSLVISLRCS